MKALIVLLAFISGFFFRGWTEDWEYAIFLLAFLGAAVGVNVFMIFHQQQPAPANSKPRPENRRKHYDAADWWKNGQEPPC